MPQENILRKILRDEITWLVFFLTAVYAFISQIIIPMNTIQIQLAALSIQLQEIKSYNASNDARITQNSNDILVLKQLIK